ncbi:class I SAM-dependent methyltransferase [Acidipropionibacterium virtanenii]|uniref:Methyltransferase domain-containing protein n=1 Tax=Acidipropionibacterium virtanenii TaxID=2057246 RepID=A0A344UVK0_9ACTN|nr:class I SAM-dependent methyltransferase [Acidipropionibacterium virtanenii]AXE39298.1 hypothetical protein JS278_02146 [Acidipropionibacterium virtanenii]
MTGTGEAADWDERYRRFPELYGSRPNDFLVTTEILLPRGARVLVVGDGQGRNGVWLAGRGHEVTSVEQSPVAVRQAQGLARARGVALTCVVADLAQWITTPEATGPWDAVVWIFVHLPRAARARIGAGLGPALQPEGRLIMETYSTAQPQLRSGGPTDPEVLSHRDDAAAHWPDLIVESRILERRIFEGRAHQGLGSVVQVLGRGRGRRPRRGAE